MWQVATTRVLQSLQQDQDEINARFEALTKEREKLQNELGTRIFTDEAIQDVLNFARDVREGMEHPDFATARRNLRILKVQIVVQDGRYSGKSILGEWEGKISQVVKGQIVPSALELTSSWRWERLVCRTCSTPA